MTDCDHLLLNATTIDAHGHQLRNQAIAITDGLIIWCGLMDELDHDFKRKATAIHECDGQLVTPGFIDCHTHLVYAGNRADEFKQRLEGKTYTEIARAGGGILSTVRETRAASEDDLLEQSLPRILAMRTEGVTTVEIKSGYGLDLDTEIKMLKVARKLGALSGLRVKTTFLGAHAVPPEFQNNAQAYVDFLCYEMIPAIAAEGLADAIDVFCESIGFTLAQTEKLFIRARDFSLPIHCHAEQLSNLGATELAAKLEALSCDHLEHLDSAGVAAMARSGTIAVLLPGAYYFLRENRKPPVDALRQMGVGMAIATDSNPGSSPTTSLPLMLNMACQFFGLTVDEALAGVSYQAAKALGLEKEVGEIAVGKYADLVCWSVSDSASLCYHFGYPLPHTTMIAGNWLSV
ncbi:imidazolonepropionase [Legionella lansingensis]|uniref:Imidazolonepropionase n=1 Tax=Legionella lansingensis TaxID=45067 RepID=A0A0W0VF98_9GAMM|nr:imidazolonepropionase [Legionella lansingensis]KTD18837.1 imidazolonepropionase [Legionella lansingensis]SNV52851.1 imidazolonepropionase [Legionella lansingensis]